MLARTLGADGYGIYSYAFAVMSLLMVLAEAGVPTLLMREVAAARVLGKWGLLQGLLRRAMQYVTFTAAAVASVGLLALSWLAGDLHPKAQATMAFMLLTLPMVAMAKTLTHAMRGLHRVVTGQALDILLRPIIALVLIGSIFSVWPDVRDPQVAMIAQLVAALLVFIVSLLIMRDLFPVESLGQSAQYRNRVWIRNTLPFVLIGGAGIVNQQADIIMLGWFVNSSDVGIYRVASQGAILTTFPFQAISAVLAPRFSSLYRAGRNRQLTKLYRRSTGILVLLTVPLILVFLFEGETLLRFLFGEGYSSGHKVLAIISLGYFCNVVFGPVGTLMQMVGKERMTAVILSITGLLNVVMNAALIPVCGLAGAALSTAFTVFLYHALLWAFYVKCV
nr:flippase [Oceanococcus sp. HetDA_MAG_MS8]